MGGVYRKIHGEDQRGKFNPDPFGERKQTKQQIPQQLGICNDFSKFRGFTFKKRCVSIPVCNVVDEVMPSSN